MIKKSTRYILFLLVLGTAASAQTNSTSPYSAFGLGLLKGPLLPQNRAMGGIGAGVSSIAGLYNINIANPASYADIRLTTFDIGLTGALTSLSRGSTSAPATFNASLSHIAFGIPVTKKSALSFGLVPYTDLGYKYKQSTKVDTNAVDHIYSGDGGLSKAYIGYAFYIGKHLKLGANASYLFGKLEQSSTADFNNTAFANSRVLEDNTVGGMNYDIGAQYSGNLDSKTRLTVGYNLSTSNNLRVTANRLDILFFDVYNTETRQYEETGAYDTLTNRSTKGHINLPAMQRAGFTIERNQKWLIGADVAMGKWADYRMAGNNPGLKNSLTLNAGGQFTPDARSVSNYFKLIDYRAGFKYDKTYIQVNGHDVNDKALTLGLGLPLPSNRGVSFYKINFSTELGQRGSLSSGLVRERYANFYIGVTLNDLWFQKFRFD